MASESWGWLASICGSRVYFLAISTAMLGPPTAAQSQIAELGHGDLVKECVEAIDDGQDATAYATELLSRSGFHLGEKNRELGFRCLEEAFGVSFQFAGGRYFNAEFEERLAAERAERIHRYEEAVVSACIEEYSKDRFRALMEPACGIVFKRIGLPE